MGPESADGFVGCEAAKGLESPSEVIGCDAADKYGFVQPGAALKELVFEERLRDGASCARARVREIAAIGTRVSCRFTWGARIAVFKAVTNGRIQQAPGTSALKSA
jgi:hypothetical protein